jgi:hypothetical protein
VAETDRKTGRRRANLAFICHLSTSSCAIT